MKEHDMAKVMATDDLFGVLDDLHAPDPVARAASGEDAAVGSLLDNRSDDDSDDGFDDDRSDDDSDDGFDDDRSDDDSDDGFGDDRSDDDSDDGFGDDRSDDDAPTLAFEYVLTVAFLFEAALDRNGNIRLEGLNFWIGVRERGVGEREVAEQFLFSNEFESKFGDPDDIGDRALVEVFFENILDRPGREAGIDHWEGALGRDDFDRVDLLLAFSLSAENADSLDFANRLVQFDDGDWGFA